MKIKNNTVGYRTYLIILVAAFFSIFSKTLGGFAYVPEADEAGNSLSLALINATNLLNANIGFWNPYSNGGFPQLLNPYQFNGSTLFFALGSWHGYALFFLVGHSIFGIFIFLIARFLYRIDHLFSVFIALLAVMSLSAWGEIDILRTYQGYTLFLAPLSIYLLCKPYDSVSTRLFANIGSGVLFGFFTPTLVYSYNLYLFILVYILFSAYFEDTISRKSYLSNLLIAFAAFSVTSVSFSLPFLLSVTSELEILTRTSVSVETYPFFIEFKNRSMIGLHLMLFEYKLLPLYLIPAVALPFAIIHMDKRLILFSIITVLFVSLFLLQNIVFQYFADYFSPLKTFTVRTKLVSYLVLIFLNIEAIRVLMSLKSKSRSAQVATASVLAIASFLGLADTTRHNASNFLSAVQGESYRNIYQHPTLIELRDLIQGTDIIVNSHFHRFRLHSNVFTFGRGIPLYPDIALAAYGIEGHENTLGLGYQRSADYQILSTPWSFKAKGNRDVYMDELDGRCPAAWPTYSYSVESARLLRHAGVSTIVSTVPFRLDGFTLTNAKEVEARRAHLCASTGAKLADPEKSFTPLYVYKTTDPVAPFIYVAQSVMQKNNDDVLATLSTDTSLIPGASAVLGDEMLDNANTFKQCRSTSLSYERSPDKIKIDLLVSSPCIVVIRQAYTPKWAVISDNKPIATFPVNHAFTGFIVNPGQTDFELTFSP